MESPHDEAIVAGPVPPNDASQAPVRIAAICSLLAVLTILGANFCEELRSWLTIPAVVLIVIIGFLFAPYWPLKKHRKRDDIRKLYRHE
jgi:purine-cytosine permease-like protein